MESPRVHKAGQSRLPRGSSVQRSELLLETFSSAVASSACEQCCCVTHMQLPEMLCNGRWQEGEPGSPAEGPGGLLQSREGCALQASLPGHWRRAYPRSWAPPRLPTPSHRHCNRRTQGGPRALLADLGRRQPEGGKALTHSASGPALVPCISPHPSPQGHLSRLHTQDSPHSL